MREEEVRERVAFELVVVGADEAAGFEVTDVGRGRAEFAKGVQRRIRLRQQAREDAGLDRLRVAAKDRDVPRVAAARNQLDAFVRISPSAGRASQGETVRWPSR